MQDVYSLSARRERIEVAGPVLLEITGEAHAGGSDAHTALPEVGLERDQMWKRRVAVEVVAGVE